MKTRISTACRIAFALLLAYSNTGFALGLSPREAWLRQDLQALTDTQHLQSLTSTWPIPWPQLKHALAEVNVATLPPYLAAAHSRLTHHLEQQTATLRLRTTVRGSSTPPLTTTFGPYHTEIASISTGIGFTANRTSGQLHLRATHDRSDPQTAQFDDSFFLQRLGNWGIGVDTVDRWWGPAWRSSLILSHNTRPIPTIFLNRQSLDPFDQAWLHWLGPWRLMTFMGRLESSRHIPNALLWGARFTFSPHPRWEVGLSRTATWAGDGRPANFDAFTDLLLGHDNFELDDPDKINEPGNQLAGIDLRYAQPIGNASVAMYTQVIGEDEAGNLPSRPILLLGASITLPGAFAPLSTIIEYQDTALDAYRDSIFNSAYNHSIYQSGYRYRGRSIGSSYDNDTRALSWGALFSLSTRWQCSLWLSHINGNRDGLAGGNPVFQTKLETAHAQITARYHMKQHQLTLASDWWEKLPNNRLARSERAGLRIDYTWQWE